MILLDNLGVSHMGQVLTAICDVGWPSHLAPVRCAVPGQDLVTWSDYE